jgi:hypothetical protein
MGYAVGMSVSGFTFILANLFVYCKMHKLKTVDLLNWYLLYFCLVFMRIIILCVPSFSLISVSYKALCLIIKLTKGTTVHLEINVNTNNVNKMNVITHGIFIAV